MTDKELRKLKRIELLELMYYLKEELEKVRQENETLKARLESQSTGQDDVNQKILEEVQNVSRKIDELCRANVLKSDEPDAAVKDSEETEQ